MTRTREGDTLLDADSAEELAATQRAILNVLEDFGDEKTELRSVRKALLNVLEDFGFEKAVLEDAQRALLNILDDFENENQKVQQANADLRRTEEKFRSQKRQAHGYGSWLGFRGQILWAFGEAIDPDTGEVKPLRSVPRGEGARWIQPQFAESPLSPVPAVSGSASEHEPGWESSARSPRPNAQSVGERADGSFEFLPVDHPTDQHHLASLCDSEEDSVGPRPESAPRFAPGERLHITGGPLGVLSEAFERVENSGRRLVGDGVEVLGRAPREANRSHRRLQIAPFPVVGERNRAALLQVAIGLAKRVHDLGRVREHVVLCLWRVDGENESRGTPVPADNDRRSAIFHGTQDLCRLVLEFTDSDDHVTTNVATYEHRVNVSNQVVPSARG